MQLQMIMLFAGNGHAVLSLFFFCKKFDELIFPFSISLAINSSIKKTFLASFFAASKFSSSARSIYSSLKVSIALVQYQSKDFFIYNFTVSNEIFLLAIFFASRNKPFDKPCPATFFMFGND